MSPIMQTEGARPSRPAEAGLWQRFAPASKVILMFFAFSFVGWAYEMLNDAIVQGGWHWRAALVGPWCPMYGIGGLLICWVCKPFGPERRSPGRKGALAAIGRVLVSAAIIALLVSVVELAASYACEALLGFMPWDYSTSWGNFEGRWAPEFTLRFVIGGLVFLYALEPLIAMFVQRFEAAAGILAISLVAMLCIDCVLEFSGVWGQSIPRGEVFVQ